MGKRPTLKRLKEALEQTQGNLTNTAALLQVGRCSLWKWAKEDPEFAEAIDESKKKFLDSCLTTARVVALGIPKVEGGKIVGWEEKPDSNMLRYFISTLGRNEGFGDSVDITSGGNAIPQIKVEVIDRREDVRREEDEA
ncbi:MAG: hypothetical protein J6V98_05420 [Bacteroidales bacterium]|nr:hypothetical protein [Bacteroidales bacterium]